jgi:hypothetical protein
LFDVTALNYLCDVVIVTANDIAAFILFFLNNLQRIVSVRAGVGNKARFLNCISSESFCGRRGPKARDEMDTEKYLPELMAEKDKLDPTFHHSLRLLDQGKKRKHPYLLWDVSTV